MPKVSGLACDVAKPGLSQKCHKFVRRGERADRRRQVAVGRVVPRDQPADPRQHVVEIPEIRRPGRAASSESRTRGPPAGRRASARGASRRRRRRVVRRCGCRRRSSPRPPTASRTGTRVASPRTSVTRSRRARRCSSLSWPTRSIARGEVDADDARRARRRRARGNRQVGGAGAQVEHALASGQPQRRDRAHAASACRCRR